MSMWKKAMDYLGLGPDDAYDDYEVAPEPERAPPPDHPLLFEVDADGVEVAVFRQQPDHRTVLAIALDGDLVLEARHHHLAIADLGRAMHGDEIAVEDADVLHGHADHLEIGRAHV